MEGDFHQQRSGTLLRFASPWGIASLPSDAQLALNAVRSHWGIENSLHWVLDVTFREDDSRVRSGNGAHNLAILRHIARNVLSGDESSDIGCHNKRLRAGWDNSVLEQMLSRSFA